LGVIVNVTASPVVTLIIAFTFLIGGRLLAVFVPLRGIEMMTDPTCANAGCTEVSVLTKQMITDKLNRTITFPFDTTISDYNCMAF
jgi:hypothetical protein